LNGNHPLFNSIEVIKVSQTNALFKRFCAYTLQALVCFETLFVVRMDKSPDVS